MCEVVEHLPNASETSNASVDTSVDTSICQTSTTHGRSQHEHAICKRSGETLRIYMLGNAERNQAIIALFEERDLAGQ